MSNHIGWLPPSPVPSETGSTKSSPSAPSVGSGPGSSTLGRSARVSDINSKYEGSPYIPKCAPKSVLKNRESRVSSMPPLFDEITPIVAASKAMDDILSDLVTGTTQFKLPSELDFPANTGDNMALPYTEKNIPFIDQLRKLDGLRIRLDEIPTHGKVWLEDKNKYTNEAIGRAVQRMKGHHIRLHEKASFVEEAAAAAALDGILTALLDCAKNFRPPSELDFSASTENSPVLSNTEKNRPFIHHLRRLHELRSKLAEIPTHGDKRLGEKREVIGKAIGQALQKVKKHEAKLYVKASLDGILTALTDYIKEFKSPSELDLSTSTEGAQAFLESEENELFIAQLRKLDELRFKLPDLPGAPQRPDGGYAHLEEAPA
ncbi:hypothetical protein FRC11_006501 [Ceratobasidium sp. 423]|nr:hypothetical protein FRC11_006501 [Ceratobasidium sp. 423]